nr:glycosyltransferase [Clostridium paraputrificum]
MKEINLYLCPADSDNSEYIKNTIKELKRHKVNLIHKKGQEGIKNILCGIVAAMKYDNIIFHFNFIENATKKDTFSSRMKSILYLVWIDLLKLFGAKLCWTMHNRYPHDCENIELSNKFYKRIIKRMDNIFIHCHKSRSILVNEYSYPDEKITYIPHGNFIREIKKIGHKNKLIKKYGINKNELVILHFGTVLKYKNVPILINSFNKANLKNAKLLIAGKIKDGLEDIINEKVKGNKNIILLNEFVSEEDIDELYAVSDIAVIPYEKDSMLNSGVLIMAFSQSLPAIVSEFGVVKDLRGKEFIFSYNYENPIEHEEKLIEQLKKAYEVYVNNKISVIGNKAYEYAEKDLNWNDIGDTLVESYLKLI